MRPTDPQSKKRLSYSKDGRNAVAKSFGESGATARFSISKRKAAANKALRRAEKTALSTAALGVGDREEIDVSVPRIGRKSFRKIPDVPLSVAVEDKLSSRRLSEVKVSPTLRAVAKTARAVPRKAPKVIKERPRQ